MIGTAVELGAQFFVLRGDTDWAGVQVTLAHHDDPWSPADGGERILRPQHRRDDHITAGT